MDIYDSAISTKAIKSGAMLDIVDACSLLYRLELEGQKVEKRWEEIFETCYKHNDDHTLAFNDSHLFMCYSANKEKDVASSFLKSMESFATLVLVVVVLFQFSANYSPYLFFYPLLSYWSILVRIQWIIRANVSKKLRLISVKQLIHSITDVLKMQLIFFFR